MGNRLLNVWGEDAREDLMKEMGLSRWGGRGMDGGGKWNKWQREEFGAQEGEKVASGLK